MIRHLGGSSVRRNLFWLSDEQWERIEPHLPTDVRGVERADDRRVISGIVHVLKSGCRWCDCPPEYGPPTTIYNRFSNRPLEVKRFQTIHRCSVDVAHRLVLLFGISTKALPVWDSRTRWNNLCGGLTVRVTVGPSDYTNSPHPSSREGHHSTAGWSSSVLLLHLILHASHAAVASLVHRNSVPSTQMRCMMTANRRASATIAFFIPRCLAIFIAQALSHDHLAECTSMLWAAS
jgi:transposase